MREDREERKISFQMCLMETVKVENKTDLLIKVLIKGGRLNERRKRRRKENEPDGDFIIGGSTSPRNLYPWAVFMFVRKNGGNYACGGTLLTSRCFNNS